MSTLRFLVGDVFDRMAELPDGSVDLILTSPPFLALRSYVPDGHEAKHREIGSEPTPAAFIDTLLALTAEWRRILAPHGSLCVELGDTYSGSGGAGGDYNDSGLREGQGKFRQGGGDGWPLAKSLSGIPDLYPWSLAYGRNLLTGQDSPAGQWRIRNMITWARPNPPVGALGDKFRPACSRITVATTAARRWFDLDAVRTEHKTDDAVTRPRAIYKRSADDDGVSTNTGGNPAGAPPLDWHSDLPDGDWLWRLPTQPYPGSHYATFPLELPRRLILAMCPPKVCRTCGKPTERITATRQTDTGRTSNGTKPRDRAETYAGAAYATRTVADVVTLGWTDCGHDDWRPGIVLDPFVGSGTTLEAALAVGRDAIGIDFDARNVDLARGRVGMFLTVEDS